MSEKNDAQIEIVRKQIAEQRTALGSPKKFTPLTHCSLELDGKIYNLHVLAGNDLEQLAIRVQAYENAALALELGETVYSGYTLQEWLTDICAKLLMLSYKAKKAKLDALENKLTGLLSDDRKTAMEIENITKLLGGAPE